MISRKVILPIQDPTSLTNNPLCMSSTPQSDKSGKIAEIPVGMEIDENGYVTSVPIHSVSVTSAQCPFPCRMAPTREVVLRAINQAMWLTNEDEPLVKSNYIGG